MIGGTTIHIISQAQNSRNVVIFNYDNFLIFFRQKVGMYRQVYKIYIEGVQSRKGNRHFSQTLTKGKGMKILT